MVEQRGKNRQACLNCHDLLAWSLFCEDKWWCLEQMLLIVKNVDPTLLGTGLRMPGTPGGQAPGACVLTKGTSAIICKSRGVFWQCLAISRGYTWVCVL